MRRRRILMSALVLAVLLLGLLVGLSVAQGPQPPRLVTLQEALGTAFTYQGRLESGGEPVNDVCDFQFTLHDADELGSQIGITQTGAIAVTEGLFTTQLDFGPDAFDGEARWLGMRVNCPGDSGFAVLTPRQALRPSPYALALPGLWTQQNLTSTNLIGGYGGNWVTDTVHGAAIGGGGESGSPNRVTDNFGTVGGGRDNQAGDSAGPTNDAIYATVGGGWGNTAGGWASAIGGGRNNIAGDDAATVGGGYLNTASDIFATVGGGRRNTANGAYATIGGGYSNTVSGLYYAIVAGGYDNIASGDYYATVSGGESNIAGADHATIGGGRNNQAISGTYATVGGGWGNAASGWSSIIGGGRNNIAGDDAATVGGGYLNTASDIFAVVGGGRRNTASGAYATISGGYSNTVTGLYYATVAGGYGNMASGQHYATISGGGSNVASGSYATIPGGGSNIAQGDYSFASGRRAQALNQGCFVWGDSTDDDVDCHVNDSFIVRASGGITMYTNSGLTSGVRVSAGGGSWSAVSDRARKENLHPVDNQELLARLAQIEISTWSYVSQDPSIRHIGPMAQDFNGLLPDLGGEGDEYINSLDADGVALAAIQGLYEQNQALQAENAAQQVQIDQLESRLTALETESAVPLRASLLPAGGLLLVGLAFGLVARRKEEKSS